MFDDHSDDLGVIFKVEEHVIDELNQKGLNLCVFVVEVVMHIYFELFRSDIAFIKTWLIKNGQPVQGGYIFINLQLFQEEVWGNEIFHVLLSASCTHEQLLVYFMAALLYSNQLPENHRLFLQFLLYFVFHYFVVFGCQ